MVIRKLRKFLKRHRLSFWLRLFMCAPDEPLRFFHMRLDAPQSIECIEQCSELFVSILHRVRDITRV
jgi:hypothetical protein